MRIIAGELKGRLFGSPRGHRTHPMGDKVRGALFNSLGDLSGLRVLDAFGGSGALSFEAVSRGALSAVVLDSDRQAQQTIAANILQLQLSAKVKLIRASAAAWLSTNRQTFDLVLLDPPYDAIDGALLERLAATAAIGATVVMSLPPTAEPTLAGNFEPLQHKHYGDAALHYFRRIS